MDIITTISKNVTAWMRATPHLDTIEKLANRAQIGFGTVQRIKNGDGNPTITSLNDVARAFGKNVGEMLIAQNEIEKEYQIRESITQQEAFEEVARYLKTMDAPDALAWIAKLAAIAADHERKKHGNL